MLKQFVVTQKQTSVQGLCDTYTPQCLGKLTEEMVVELAKTRTADRGLAGDSVPVDGSSYHLLTQGLDRQRCVDLPGAAAAQEKRGSGKDAPTAEMLRERLQKLVLAAYSI